MLRKLLTLTLTLQVIFACSADYTIWIPRSKSAEPLYRFIKDGKAGYIDSHGKVVVRPTLETYGGNYGGEFHAGLVEVSLSDGRYVDRTGKVVLDPGLYRGLEFSEGLAAATKGVLWGFIDTSGKFAIPPRFTSSGSDYVPPFSDGRALVEVNDKFGYIDHTGEFAIKPEFLDGVSFENGFARVVTDGPCLYSSDGPCGMSNPVRLGGAGENVPLCKFTYIDKTGRIITKTPYDFGRSFSEDGLAPVRIGDRWGFIDRGGSLVVSAQFEDAEPHHSGLSRIKQNKLSGYVDTSGKIVIEAGFTSAQDFSEGFAVVGDRDKCWFIDRNGKRAPFGEFEVASPFFKGLAHVRLGSDHYAYINTKGQRVFTYKNP